MSFDNCQVCPEIIPPCKPCNSGQTCVIIAQSCHVCSYTECLDNAQVSSGHYTIGSTAAIGPVSTNPGGPISSVVSGSQTTTASTTSETTSSSISSTSTPTVASTSSSETSSASTGTSSSPAAVTNSLSSIASSISSQVSSATSSSTATPASGAAATIGPHMMEVQGLSWIVMAFWLGTAVFGGRRWRL